MGTRPGDERSGIPGGSYMRWRDPLMTVVVHFPLVFMLWQVSQASLPGLEKDVSNQASPD
jgi:hypothetical protein